MMAVIFYVVGMFDNYIPGPVCLFFIYVFKDFKMDAFKALMIGEGVSIITNLGLSGFNPFLMIFTILNLSESLIMLWLIRRNDFIFDFYTLFEIGFIATLPMTIGLLVMAFGMYTTIGLPATFNLFLMINLFLLGFMSMLYGYIYNSLFKVLKKWKFEDMRVAVVELTSGVVIESERLCYLNEEKIRGNYYERRKRRYKDFSKSCYGLWTKKYHP